MLWNLDPAWLMMAIATVAVLSYFFGAALHWLMREDGFGSFGNAIIISTGFFLAILVANQQGYNLRDLHLAVDGRAGRLLPGCSPRSPLIRALLGADVALNARQRARPSA